ncbi:single-stranded-DNA-specific exonuclease RecJ [Candidatus Epulonipiscioides gigas]|nr:single-stranded-DNA-specific exonuclease RecJ [Epulopiscium sp. SCG-C07WGA-EpuloA2]
MIPHKYIWKNVNFNATNKSIIDKLLDNRAVVDKEKFLNPTLDDLHSPFLLLDMEKAVERILKSVHEQKLITIYGDYDVDGITSTSILYIFLQEIGAIVDYYIPDRIKEGYGLNENAIIHIAKTSDLVVTVDTGISAISEVALANQLELDIIITDHHKCHEQIPEAYCVIDPKRLECNYPNEAIAGVGIVFKLITAIAIKLDIKETIYKYLDIVAVGTVADVVPLIGENRALTSLGFKLMSNTQNLGLKALLNIVNPTNNPITSDLIAFQIGPRINAISRLGNAKLGVELLTTSSNERAIEIAHILDEANIKRKEIEQEIISSSIEYIENNIDLDKQKIIVIPGEGWPHGVIGIVASKILNKYYRPTIILTLEDDVYTGSARSVEGFDIFKALLAKKQYFLKFGGHEMAAGLRMAKSEVKKFIQHINEENYEILTKEILTPKLNIDLEVTTADINISLYNELFKLEPYGNGNIAPILKVRGKIYKIQLMGKNLEHIRITIISDNKPLETIGFFLAELDDFLNIGEEVEIAGGLSKNEWQNKINIQLIITDIKSIVENENKSKYYLECYQKFKLPTVINFEGKSYNELKLFIPTYEDCKVVFRCINKNPKNFMSMHKLSYILDMTEYKILQIFDIFYELGFLSYKYDNNRIYYIIENYIKNKLENSCKFNLLSEFLKGE